MKFYRAFDFRIKGKYILLNISLFESFINDYHVVVENKCDIFLTLLFLLISKKKMKRKEK